MFSEISTDTLVGVWEIEDSYINCTKIAFDIAVECRYSKYLDNEVERIRFDLNVVNNDDVLKWVRSIGPKNVEYTGQGEIRLLNHTFDIYGRKILYWDDGRIWTKLGIISLHLL